MFQKVCNRPTRHKSPLLVQSPFSAPEQSRSVQCVLNDAAPQPQQPSMKRKTTDAVLTGRYALISRQ